MRRVIIDVVPPRFRELWSEWQLRVVVLISLILQMVLIIFGSRRKYITSSWIRFVVWSAYLAADSVAAIALGVISSNLGEIFDDKGSINANVELTVFWAPFLLFHLGGPDTITAYSIEDNELWLRHLLGFVVQAMGTLYIFLMAWTGSLLSKLTILMIFAGLFKYGERTWVLRSASAKQFRGSKSVARSSTTSPVNCNLVKEYNLRDAEGYNVIPNRVIEIQLPLDSAIFEDNSISSERELLAAYGLFEVFKALFVDLILGSQDKDTSQTIFRSISCENAFRLIEMELGFMYDLLYTKAMMVYNPWGFALRLVCFVLTSIVLVLFSLSAKQKHYSKIDLYITFVLLVAAILLEMYAILLLLFSDWTIVWLSIHNRTSALQRIRSFPLFRSPRWSNSVAQYSLLSFILKEPVIFHAILKHFSIVEQLEQYAYVTYVEVPSILKEWIFNHLKEKLKAHETDSVTYNLGSGTSSTAKGNLVLQKYGHSELNWSTEVEVDQSILIWHIATEICYNLETDTDTVQSKLEISKVASQYMLYLLVMNPAMLPTGIGQFVLEDTCAEAVEFFSTAGKTDVHSKLLQQYTTRPQLLGDRYRSKLSVLSDGCRLAQDLINISNKEEKWNMIADVWAETVVYVANQSNGRQHAEQLTGGGQFLSHVWLLMAHFGLTGHFQVPQRRALARLIVR